MFICGKDNKMFNNSYTLKVIQLAHKSTSR